MSLYIFLAIFKCQILLQGTSDTTNIVIYHTVTIKKSEKKVASFGFTICLVIKMVLDLLKWLKETSFYEKKKNYKNMNICTKGKFILRIKKQFMNFWS